MGGLRSWAGSLLSLITFFVVRSLTRSLATPMFVAITVGCIYIWMLVLRVPEMRDIKPEDPVPSEPVGPSRIKSTAADATPPVCASQADGSSSCASSKTPSASASTTASNANSTADAPAARSIVCSSAASTVQEAESVADESSVAANSTDVAEAVDIPAVQPSAVQVEAAAMEAECTAREPAEISALAESATTEESFSGERENEKCVTCENNGTVTADAHANASEKEDSKDVQKDVEGEEDEESQGDADDNASAEDSDASTDEEERQRREKEEEDEHTDPQRAQELRLEGNEFFKAGKLHDAREAYSEALYLTPSADKKEKSVLYSNRAACHLKLSRWDDVVSDCKMALELDEGYAKAYNRRSVAYENLGRWHDANEDLKKAIELDPSLRSKEYKRQAMLETRAQEQFEKDKDEMMGKLKDLGNMVLGKFGMSVDNFKCEKDPDSGSYSIKFQN